MKMLAPSLKSRNILALSKSVFLYSYMYVYSLTCKCLRVHTTDMCVCNISLPLKAAAFMFPGCNYKSFIKTYDGHILHSATKLFLYMHICLYIHSDTQTHMCLYVYCIIYILNIYILSLQCTYLSIHIYTYLST